MYSANKLTTVVAVIVMVINDDDCDYCVSDDDNSGLTKFQLLVVVFAGDHSVRSTIFQFVIEAF